MLKSIRGTYERMKSCVRSKNVLSDFFKKPNKCFTGEVLSPVFFSIYVNDFEMDFLTKNLWPSLRI